jgi:hypothetical protein
MRANSAVAIALQLPLFAVASSHGHAHAHAEIHRRALSTEVHVVTETVYTTVRVAASATSSSLSAIDSSSVLIGTVLPHKDVSSVAPPVASPSVAPPQDNNDMPYKALIAEPENAIIVNSCNYDVYVWSIGDTSCSSGANGQLLSANSTYREPIHKCNDGGIALKTAKAKAMDKPMQFEYAVWDDKRTISYDISYLDCMKNDNGEQDLSACAGHDGGIQAAGGGDCPTYQCVANEWCPQKAYVVAEFGYQPGAPVGGCTVEKGVAFELCAQNRS